MATFDSLSTLLAGIKANPRLRLGLWSIVAIAWVYGLLLLRDEVRLAAAEHQAVSRKVARIQGQATQTEWIARVEPARSAQLELEGRLWRESTVGLAQAAFQDWLNQAVQQANVTRATVTVAAQDESVPDKSATNPAETGAAGGFWKVSAKVSFDFTPKGLYALLGRLAGHDKQIVIESLVVRGAPTPRAELVLVAYFQKPTSPDQPTESGDSRAKPPAAAASPTARK